MAEAERTKPRAMYVEEAIQAALESRWAEAAAINRAIVDKYGLDEETSNRLGKALSEQGQLEEALKAYERTLEINPLNIIAQKNTRKFSAMLEARERVSGMGASIDVDLFAEEPGKSALTVLSPPSETVKVSVAPGDVVDLSAEGDRLVARTARGVLLGDVDTKIARRLLPLMATGNRYTAAVARVEDGRTEVMLREVYQAPENARKSSFPISRGHRREEFRPYAKESLLASRGVDNDAGDEDEFENHDRGGSEGGGDDEMEGMSTVEGEAEEGGAFEVEDEGDDDSRPEDEY